MTLLKLFRGLVPQTSMDALTIIEPFDVFKDLASCLITGAIPLVGEQFILQGTEEALGDRVVVAVPLPAHAGEHLLTREPAPIGVRRIRAASIRMMDEIPVPHYHFLLALKQLLIPVQPLQQPQRHLAPVSQ